jgi:hypothetical protein
MSLICAIECIAIKQKAPVSDGRGFVFVWLSLRCLIGRDREQAHSYKGHVSLTKYVFDTDQL